MLYFLLNFGFAFIELIVGYWSNSLSLQSDAWHMFNDSMATFWACIAIVINRWPKSRQFSYGFKRVEVLFAFLNCVFLLTIGLKILKTACIRLHVPENLDHEHLLWVSVAGLIVNLLGVFAFSHAHAHSHGAGSSHSHGHSHGGGDHGHGHSHGGSGSNVLVASVYFHILVDTGGSVGVIISGQLDRYLGWKRADPICSFILAILILMTVKDVIADTWTTLLQGSNESVRKAAKAARNNVMMELRASGVRECQDSRIWTLTGDENYCVCMLLVEAHLTAVQLDQIRKHAENIFSQGHLKARVIFTTNETEVYQDH